MNDDDGPLLGAIASAFTQPDIRWGIDESTLTKSELRRAVSQEHSVRAVANAQELAYAELELWQRRGFARGLAALKWVLDRLFWFVSGVVAGATACAPAIWVHDVTGSWWHAALVSGFLLAPPVLAGVRRRFVPIMSPALREPVLSLTPYAVVGVIAVWTAPTIEPYRYWVLAGMGGAAVLGVFRRLENPLRLRRRDSLVALSVRKEWEQVLLTDGVLPFLRRTLNAHIGPRYAPTLAIPDSPGLRTSHAQAMHVHTPSGVELTRIVTTRGRGSIALAGPRGSGKTSLMRAFCDGRYRERERLPDLTLVVSAPVRYEPKEFVLHLYAALCRRVIEYARGQDPDAPDPAKLFRRRGNSFRPESMGLHGVWNRPTRIADLADLAVARLFTVRALQTYTGEIAGKAGRAGVELSGKRSVAVATRALTYPEIVDELSEFLRQVASTLQSEPAVGGVLPGRVIVGIDELDRLGTGEQAAAFLNEIKAIFGASGCFFLVSVSEDAMYQFDLASPGLRTVFDSSFDEVVRVGHLSLDSARALLDHQTVGLPRQFSALVHVLSGGIPRDLVRYSAALADLRDLSLEDVTRTLAGQDLDRVCRSAAHAVGPQNPALFGLLADRPPLSDAELSRYAGRLLEVPDSSGLRDVVAANVALLATVLAVFTSDLGAEDRPFDRLAEVKRDSGVSPVAALSRLNDCRAALGLPPLPRAGRADVP
ncbi:hypothetical protein FKR81_01490 [Lentzea tibetensis]|uniref:Uncharacterized protein n=1 Tax=Lentzea tibetensis TaxID=2591470 RepID=A0A563F2Q0_9PSEU|nr:GTPase domain-containing protein [Lentzea tibetensis]TWP54256.1 hypothetical protein FKR81_01490 [Lentzea tibetensis]